MKKSKSNLYQFELKNYNNMASAVENKLIEIRHKNLQKVMICFEGNNHKIETVKFINGIEFIDDAASQNINAIWYALSCMYKPTVWIMSISDIEYVTEDVWNLIKEKVKSIVLHGIYNSESVDFFAGLNKKMSITMNLEDAVRTAFYDCERGDAVLYSPGSAIEESLYNDISERGEKYKNAISQL